MLKQLRDKIDELELRVVPPEPDIKFDDDIIRAPHLYSPEATVKKLFKSKARIKFILGAYGSGKSTGCIHYILKKVCGMPKLPDGVRRAKIAVVRNTKPELISTFLITWKQWFGELGVISERQKPIHTLTHVFYDDKGRVELELLLLGLDKEKDVNKLSSLEVTGCYFNEVQYIPHVIFTHMNLRIGRLPKQVKGKYEYEPFVIADTNAPDSEHWLPAVEKAAKLTNSEVYEFFHQPPALIKIEDKWQTNPDAENLKFLPIGYYDNMLVGTTEEFKRVYGAGEYGLTKVGKPVFLSYNDDLHSEDELKFDPNYEVYVGWDYGTVAPACVIMQMVEGQLRAIKEFVGEYVLLGQFAHAIVLPWINANLDGYHIVSEGDPANTFNGTDVLNELKFHTQPARTNAIGKRLEAVDGFLNTLVLGKSAFVLSRKGCPTLRKGFMGWYSRKRIRIVNLDSYKDVPNKTHPYSDVQDCVQYGALYYKNAMEVSAFSKNSKRRIRDEFYY